MAGAGKEPREAALRLKEQLDKLIGLLDSDGTFSVARDTARATLADPTQWKVAQMADDWATVLRYASGFQPDQTGSQGRIEDFFEQVGSGVIEAQRRLDDHSRQYLEEVRRQGRHALPSVFRIPKAEAEIRFGITSIEGEKLGVVVYGKHSSREEEMQHRVNFEIVSVPPPADWKAGPEAFLLQDRMQRDLVRAKLTEAVGAVAADDVFAVSGRTLLEGFSTVLAFVDPGDPEGGAPVERILLVMPRSGAKGLLGLRATLADWRWESAPLLTTQVEQAVRETLVHISGHQRVHFARRGGTASGDA